MLGLLFGAEDAHEDQHEDGGTPERRQDLGQNQQVWDDDLSRRDDPGGETPRGKSTEIPHRFPKQVFDFPCVYTK
ncbi:hypothetical protein [Frigoribacterium sp. SL97]|uniref:hypothetical protein n=1 Tax=Frigoribacterium sp. SL97 TaxID=2994664 RepID=UPI002271903E|nr:hypothetical protein [Frigoribacterium sp. SL97]WAC52165.1 hypothetical protein OVA02_02505 [Frigoribacterium sp. SL97]